MDGVNESNDEVSTNLESWIEDINEEWREMRSFIPKSSIHRLPAYLRANLPPHYYKARLVKFGPYHGTRVILPSHRIKRPVLLYFLKRSNKSLDVYVEALREVAQDLREMYDDLGPDHWLQDNNAFIKLMILDGCFLIEILRELKNYANSDHPLWDVDGNSRSKLVEDYKHDMLLLENQLPMELLVRLIAVQSNTDIGAAHGDVNEWIWRIIFPTLCFCNRGIINRRDYESTHLHVLDLYRHYLVYLEDVQMEIDRTAHPPFDFNIPSLTDLKDVGIEIGSDSTGLMGISFASDQKPMLKLPQIYINDGTQTMFINLIAFEQLGENANNEVSSYIYLMSRLIKGANDVSILKSCGVIRSSLDNDQLAKMLDSLAKDILHDPLICFPYRDVGAELERTFSTRKQKKKLWRKYLGSPWAIFSHVFAFLVFALTAVQTVYTVLSHHNSK